MQKSIIIGDKYPLVGDEEIEEFKDTKYRPRILCIIQARETSKRFPNKIYATLKGVPVLYHVLDRVKRAKLLDDIVVASPHDINVPEGVVNVVPPSEEEDVLSRYFIVAKGWNADYILRVTSDCPLLDSALIDFIIYTGINYQADYCSNVMVRTFPDGLDAELISYPALKYLSDTVRDPYHREHVTTFIREYPDTFDVVSVENYKDESHVKWSIDTPKDLQEIEKIM